MAIIETVRTRCRDCYKCVRACPVKAIKVERGPLLNDLRSAIVEDYCIHDGTCLRECPQKARRARNDVPSVRAMLQSGEMLAASIAPSFAAAIPVHEPLRLVTALRKLGFSIVQETALGAEMVSAVQKKLSETSRRPRISSSCPAVVSLIEKHYPEAIEFLSPLVSPAVAHGRYLKSRYPGIRVVFIGPCVAKKEEIADPEVSDAVDVALTFGELWEWFESEGINPRDCPPGDFDGPLPSVARLFPADGGFLRCLGADGLLTRRTVSASGVRNCVDMIRYFMAGRNMPEVAELMACPGGCISGPFALDGYDQYERRERLIHYYERMLERHGQQDVDYGSLLPADKLLRKYRNKKTEVLEPTEEQIRAILEKTGKFSPEDELNCGACGYGSCREKAVAVFNGMADPEMCIPYMRQRAESMANLVVSATPTGVIVTSWDGTIIDMNQAAERMLGVGRKNCVGLPVSAFMDAACFHEASVSRTSAKGRVSLGQLVVDLQVLFVADHKLLVGLMVDVTQEVREQEHKTRVAEEAVRRAQQVIEKQMAVAQKIAGLLGETTAETKVSLTQLIKVIQDDRTDGTKG